MRETILALSLALLSFAPALAAHEAKPEVTESTAEEDGDLTWLEKRIVQFARDPRFRHQLTAFLNKNNGKWVYRMNAIKLKRAWKRTAVPHLEKVTADLWRGGQPNAKGFQELKDKGVKTVINLRLEDDSERGTCMLLGLRYVYLPMPDTNPPTPEQLKEFLAALANKDRGLTYVHCAAGTFRTGTMVAVYRMMNGMSFEKAYAELIAHGFDPEMMDASYQLAFLKEFAAQLAAGAVQKP